MKNLIVFVSLILSFSAAADVGSSASFNDSIQEGKIEAAYLNMLLTNLEKAEVTFDEKVKNLPEPTSNTEGKIQAAIINMVELEFEKAAVLLDALENAASIDDASTKDLREKTVLINKLISEL